MDTAAWRRHGSTLRTALDIAATLAMAAAAATLIWTARGSGASNREREIPLPSKPLPVDDAPALGSATARLVLFEFSDFQCPYWGKFERETLPGLKQRYIDTGKIQLIFRNLPLAIHNHAERAADAGACANIQRRFWPMHDVLFLHQDKLDEADLVQDASLVGLDEHAFETCMSGATFAAVRRDEVIAQTAGLRGTPSFLIGVRVSEGAKIVKILTGAAPSTAFDEALKPLLRG